MTAVIDRDVVTSVSTSNSGDATPTSSGTSIKGKGRQRLLRGLQRISSSPSLNGLRRSRSASSPYSTRASLSCVSLAAVAPPQTPSTARSSTPQPSPLGLPSAPVSLSQASTHEFPLYDNTQGQLSVRKVDNIDPNRPPPTATVPAGVAFAKHEASAKAQAVVKAHPKPAFPFWEKMPHELRVQIFSFLGPKELVRSSRVSKSFYRFCFDGQLWTSLDASEFYQDIPAESLSRIIVAAGPFIKDLNLRGCVQVEHYKRTEVIVKACRNLMNATLEGCRNFQKSTLHTLLRANDKLIHLNLTGLSAVSNTSCKIIAESCPQLETLNVSWCDKVEAKGIKAIVESCPKLRDLRAGEVRGFDDISTAETIYNTNNLERLVLCGCVELTDDALKVMMQGTSPEIDILTDRPIVPPRKLRHLDLSRCNRLSSAGVKAIGYAVPELQGLRLSGCKTLTDAALEPILASTPRLTHLELEDLEDLTNALMSEHLARAPCADTLEHLSISYCENIGDVGMLPVLQKCLRLRSIDMDNTRISDLSLAEAAAMVNKRSQRWPRANDRPEVTLQLVVYDCQNVTWTGIREVLFRNAHVKPAAGEPGKVTYPTEVIGLKCFYGFQMTVDEHQKRVLRGDFSSAGRLERKWADYMQANEEVGMGGAGQRRRRRRAREAHAQHLNEEDGGLVGRRRARTMGACSMM
ncbi:F-box/LRR repeat containing protein 2 [Metarhizium album ARSEF 1941]|uniref:F-box/LRR repeat containing protein 2 n=1 Tax=Metarhizium album (strain ARSEF 1941) TaxID=1081103 RepID=A0A0B2WTD8_METAS|nr:F-box/LRR repeat containing protein 2 [Metarhizium album ARSEF 1941]KHN96225.1 F-box/LRR repeat containing protein 2 [Metarhizium album ARSEF 1941]